MKILFEDENIIVPVKPIGISSEEGMTSALSELTGGSVFAVHRLDTAVGGVMVYAKTKPAAAHLSAQIADKKLIKQYLAVVEGTPDPKNGEMCDLLFKDSKRNKSFVVQRERKGVKKARLWYETLAEKDGMSLIKITLDTGRSHQIRVQFSHRKMPLWGDGKYGSRQKGNIALFSHSLTLLHPVTNEKVTFLAEPDTQPFTRFI